MPSAAPEDVCADLVKTDRGVILQWRDITYTVTKKTRDGDDVRVILDGLSGDATGGHLLALMGPSGSGKTSLLNALAFRVPKGLEPPSPGPCTRTASASKIPRRWHA